MFKRIKAYFAGVPANELPPVLDIPKIYKECGACKELGYMCQRCFVPGEPVLSILRAVKTRRKTFLFATDNYYDGYRAFRYRYAFADTVTGRVITAHRDGYGVSAHVADGLTQPEIEWLIDHITKRLNAVQARAAALAAYSARRQLMQEYIQ